MEKHKFLIQICQLIRLKMKNFYSQSGILVPLRSFYFRIATYQTTIRTPDSVLYGYRWDRVIYYDSIKGCHSGDKYVERNFRLHYYVLKSLASLDNTTNIPERDQLLHIVPRLHLKIAHLCIEGKKKQREVLDERKAKRKLFLMKGRSPSAPSLTTSIHSDSLVIPSERTYHPGCESNDNLSYPTYPLVQMRPLNLR